MSIADLCDNGDDEEYRRLALIGLAAGKVALQFQELVAAYYTPIKTYSQAEYNCHQTTELTAIWKLLTLSVSMDLVYIAYIRVCIYLSLYGRILRTVQRSTG